jgi:hypothetical protein
MLSSGHDFMLGDDLKFNVTIGDMAEGELTAKRVT